MLATWGKSVPFCKGRTRGQRTKSKSARYRSSALGLESLESRILYTAIVTNGSFESDSVGHTGNPTGWYIPVTGVSTSVVSTEVTDGQKALQITCAGSSYDLLEQDIPGSAFTAGTTYTLSGDITVDSSQTSAALYLNVNGNVIPMHNTASSGSGTVHITSDPFTYAGSASAYFQLEMFDNSGTGQTTAATFDNLAITPTAGSYPVVTSLSSLDTGPTNASTLSYTVTFSDAVTGVDSTDFTLNSTSGITGASILQVSGSGSSYTVTISTGSGDGTLGLNLVDDDSITSAGGQPLGGNGADNGSFSGDGIAIDKTSPSASISQSGGVSGNILQYNVAFSESVSGVDLTDFTVVSSGLSGTSITAVSGSGNTYVVSVDVGSGTGTLSLTLVDDDTIHDAASNSLGGPGQNNGNVTGPSVSVGHTYDNRKVTNSDGSVDFWATDPSDSYGLTDYSNHPLWGPNGPVKEDFVQAIGGDCWLFATMSSRPDLASAMISADAGGGWVVTFMKGGVTTRVHEDSSLSNRIVTWTPDGSIGGYILEKAFIAMTPSANNTYNGMPTGNPGDLQQKYDSRWPAFNYHWNTTLANFDSNITSALASGKPVMLLTLNSQPAGQPDLIADHFYLITQDYTGSDSQVHLVMRNPWGYRDYQETAGTSEGQGYVDVLESTALNDSGGLYVQV